MLGWGYLRLMTPRLVANCDLSPIMNSALRVASSSQEKKVKSMAIYLASSDWDMADIRIYMNTNVPAGRLLDQLRQTGFEPQDTFLEICIVNFFIPLYATLLRSFFYEILRAAPQNHSIALKYFSQWRLDSRKPCPKSVLPLCSKMGDFHKNIEIYGQH